LRQASDILGQILVIGFFVIAAVTPIMILVLSILNFTRYPARRTAITLKALAALAIWAGLTFLLIMIFIMVVFQFPSYVSQSNALIETVIFVVGALIYALVGGGLIYWMKRQSKPMPAMGLSC
jgi:hypothetical protein